ncbi:MAG TPA: sulfurtransferase [bacterium]|jgi:thiosulfate/3-mercaptopyruvate sulfurtransferase
MLISTEELARRLGEPGLVIADMRWDASQPDAGRDAFRTGHIPGAIYVDVDTELSDRSDLSKGRHPLPDPEQFVRTLARLGIGEGTTLVVYDDKAGSLAARLWWMMRWVGGAEALVLDGGFAAWVAEERPVETGPGKSPLPHPQPLAAHANVTMVANYPEVKTQGDKMLLLDARSAERYRGEGETIDTRAGHIPGAINAPWADNVKAEGVPHFKTPSMLRSHFESLGVRDGRRVVCSCGSGVTACHDLLALEIAGLHGARLYPGSWSEWIAKDCPDTPLMLRGETR